MVVLVTPEVKKDNRLFTIGRPWLLACYYFVVYFRVA